jgi:pimeloyl-ACP methyl ester carboxylesterase
LSCETAMMINNIPALLIGPDSSDLFLFVHGQYGCKEEARAFAKLTKAKVLAIDLPCHGERAMEKGSLDPMHAVPELEGIMVWARQRYDRIGLRANSIGAYFSLLAFKRQSLFASLLVSPVVNMVGMIESMMKAQGVDEEDLRREKRIQASTGPALDWEYLQYALAHPLDSCQSPSFILYGGQDSMVRRLDVESFARRLGCRLTVEESCEHWFHTPQQLRALDSWTLECLASI